MKILEVKQGKKRENQEYNILRGTSCWPLDPKAAQSLHYHHYNGPGSSSKPQ